MKRNYNNKKKKDYYHYKQNLPQDLPQCAECTGVDQSLQKKVKRNLQERDKNNKLLEKLKKINVEVDNEVQKIQKLNLNGENSGKSSIDQLKQQLETAKKRNKLYEKQSGKFETKVEQFGSQDKMNDRRSRLKELQEKLQEAKKDYEENLLKVKEQKKILKAGSHRQLNQIRDQLEVEAKKIIEAKEQEKKNEDILKQQKQIMSDVQQKYEEICSEKNQQPKDVKISKEEFVKIRKMYVPPEIETNNEDVSSYKTSYQPKKGRLPSFNIGAQTPQPFKKDYYGIRNRHMSVADIEKQNVDKFLENNKKLKESDFVTLQKKVQAEKDSLKFFTKQYNIKQKKLQEQLTTIEEEIKLYDGMILEKDKIINKMSSQLKEACGIPENKSIKNFSSVKVRTQPSELSKSNASFFENIVSRNISDGVPIKVDGEELFDDALQLPEQKSYRISKINFITVDDFILELEVFYKLRDTKIVEIKSFPLPPPKEEPEEGEQKEEGEEIQENGEENVEEKEQEKQEKESVQKPSQQASNQQSKQGSKQASKKDLDQKNQSHQQSQTQVEVQVEDQEQQKEQEQEEDEKEKLPPLPDNAKYSTLYLRDNESITSISGCYYRNRITCLKFMTSRRNYLVIGDDKYFLKEGVDKFIMEAKKDEKPNCFFGKCSKISERSKNKRLRGRHCLTVIGIKLVNKEVFAHKNWQKSHQSSIIDAIQETQSDEEENGGKIIDDKESDDEENDKVVKIKPKQQQQKEDIKQDKDDRKKSKKNLDSNQNLSTYPSKKNLDQKSKKNLDQSPEKNKVGSKKDQNPSKNNIGSKKNLDQNKNNNNNASKKTLEQNASKKNLDAKKNPSKNNLQNKKKAK